MYVTIFILIIILICFLGRGRESGEFRAFAELRQCLPTLNLLPELLLRNLTSDIITKKPDYLVYLHITVLEMKFQNSNPVFLRSKSEWAGALPRNDGF